MWSKTTFASLFVCLVSVLSAAQTYTIRDLGPLSPTGINSWAQVVGNSNNQAYIWNHGHMRALGLLPGGTFSSAAAINDRGVVTGTADGAGTLTFSSVSYPCSDLTQPFVWKPNTNMQGLGTVGWALGFLSCDIPFYGTAINDSGQVVGDMPIGPDLYAWGFLWTAANGMTLIGASWPPTFGNGISNTGLIVGQNSDFSTDYDTLGIGHATTWKSDVVTDLGTLGGGADVMDYGSSANGVNDLGVIVGWSTTSSVVCCGEIGSPVHAVLWTPARVISDLGTLPGDTSSAASKVNLFGQIIGSSGNTLYAWNEFPISPFVVVGRPFVWTKNSGMQDLNTMIPANSGWVLNSATDINAFGQIVGQGTLNGQAHGYLLTPKNPFQVF